MKRNSWSVIGTVLFVLLVCSPVESANGGANQNGTGESAYALDGARRRLRPGNPLEPGLHRHHPRNEYRQLREPASRGDRPRGHVRQLQRDRAPLDANLHGARRSEKRVAARGDRASGLPDAFGPVPGPASPARCRARYRDGAPRQRTIGGARARVGQRGGSRRARVAVGGRLCGFHPVVHGRDRGGAVAADTAGVRADELADDRLHHAVCRVQPVSVPPGHASGLDHRDVHERLQCGQGARTQDRFDPHARPDRARCLLGVQRDHSLERRGEPDRARQRNLVAARTSACLRS